jgi:hypothetical protein
VAVESFHCHGNGKMQPLPMSLDATEELVEACLSVGDIEFLQDLAFS